MEHIARVDRSNIDAKKPEDSDKDLFITVFTDASWCPSTKAYGYAVWIRDGQKPIHMFGDGGVGMESSFFAETAGLEAARKHILEHCDVTDRILVIQCDNIGALNNLNLMELKERGIRFIKRKHVKGHTAHKTNRSKVNELVDKLAGNHMRAHRATLRGQNA